MFIESKYKKWYFDIVNSAGSRTTEGYTEKHHIIPKCLGGDNSPSNLVKLTAREHFLCHWLLTKMVTSPKQKYQLWNAFSCMLYRQNDSQARHKITARVFDNIKSTGAKIKSSQWSGENNPMFGRRGEDSPIFGRKQKCRHIENSRQARTGMKRTEESIDKQRGQLKGIPKSAEHKNKISESLCGDKNPMFGKKLSAEAIIKRTATLKANKLAKRLAQGE
jgi:hypothetical protein